MNKCHMIIHNIYITKQYRERTRKMILCSGASTFLPVLVALYQLIQINTLYQLIQINSDCVFSVYPYGFHFFLNCTCVFYREILCILNNYFGASFH